MARTKFLMHQSEIKRFISGKEITKAVEEAAKVESDKLPKHEVEYSTGNQGRRVVTIFDEREAAFFREQATHALTNIKSNAKKRLP